MNRTRTFAAGWIGILLGMGILPLWAQAPATAPASRPSTQPADQVIYRINGENVTQSELDQTLQAMMMQRMRQWQQRGGQGAPPNREQLELEMAEEARERLIDAKVFHQVIRKDLDNVGEDAINARLAQFRALVEADGKSLEDIMARSGRSEADFRNEIRGQLAAEIIVGRMIEPVDPTPPEIEAFFDAHKDEMGEPEKLRTSHILLGYKGNPRDPNFKPSEEEKAELSKQAQATLERVKAGEDFAAVAREVSTGPSAADGGDLDFNPRGRMVPAYDAAAWILEDGEISGIVETQFGYHIIKRTGHNDGAGPDFETVKGQIEMNLRNQKMQNDLPLAVAKLRQDATVEIAGPDGAFKPLADPAPATSAPASRPSTQPAAE